jgi:hypothetical protein
MKRRSFISRISFVLLRPPYKALLDAFVCILGILRQTFLCLILWVVPLFIRTKGCLGFGLILEWL